MLLKIVGGSWESWGLSSSWSFAHFERSLEVSGMYDWL